MAYGIAFEFLDVGMGDATLVQLPPWDRGALCLIDFGEKGSAFKIAARDATWFLIDRITTVCRNKGLNDRPFLDYLFISHADGDHWNKLGWLIDGNMSDEFPDETDLWATRGKYKSGTTLKIGWLGFGGDWNQDFVAKNKKLANKIRGASTNVLGLADKDHDEEDLGSGITKPRFSYKPGDPATATKISLLSSNVPQKEGGDCNPKSLVWQFQYRDLKVILPGDAEKVVEKRMMDWYSEDVLRSQVLKLAHHGSAYSSIQEFLDAVRPQAVFATGDKRWGHPYCNPIDRAWPYLADNQNHYYSCSASGADNDYKSPKTTKNVCTNLWYVVTKDKETLPGFDGKMHTVDKGLYTGVQWRLQYDSDSATIYLASTDAWPKP